jgi:hypothetical protein
MYSVRFRQLVVPTVNRIMGVSSQAAERLSERKKPRPMVRNIRVGS